MQSFFITGTDTDCGKTYVTCQLLKYFHAKQRKAIALKPIATGCGYQEDKYAGDVQILNSYNQNAILDINGWQFREPISPHLASKLEGVMLSAQEIVNFCYQDHFSAVDYLLIEGAGGLLVPLNESETWLDFLCLTRIPVILVVGMRLGCLNHALLTDTVMDYNPSTSVGWIANCLDETMLALSDNIETLTNKMHTPLLAIIDYKGDLKPTSAFYDLVHPAVLT